MHLGRASALPRAFWCSPSSAHLRLPRYQFTARIVPESRVRLAFSAVHDSTYALLFADRLLDHVAACGVKLRDLTVQTDNGSEFGGG